MPSAEVEITDGLVRELLAGQHPDLADRPLTALASGWDNVLYRVGDDLIARLPRREAAVALTEHEQRWLPVLAPRLPLLVPVPVRTGQPARGYPWPWSIVPFIPGEPAGLTPPSEPGEAARSLGGFLAELHRPAPPQAPANPFRGVPLHVRAPGDLKNLSMLDGRVDRDTVLRAWDDAKAVPRPAGPPVWLHGDLHALNILVHDGQLSGVIDFGDLTSGDPATDLSIAWMLFDDAADRETFFATYAADEVTRIRARGWAMAFAVVFLAHSADNPPMDAIGRRSYANLTSPS